MKQYLFGLTILSAAMTLSSCQRELNVLADGQKEGVAVFTASIESGATKTALNKNGDDYDVLWRSGDAIAVVDNAANKGVYTTESVTSHAEFILRSGDAATTPDYKAWYPAGIYNDGTPTLPAVQTYVEGRSAAEGNICQAPMYAESGTSNLEFKNLCGIVRLNITTSLSTIKVRRIVLRADKGMSGAISNHASLATDGYAAAVSGTAGVTLDCGSPCIPINSTARAFYVAIPAGTYTNFSITVEVYNTYHAGWYEQTKTFTDPVVIERSKIATINASFGDSYAPISPDSAGDPIDLSARETANTYIVSAAGNYKFKATVKGNGGFDPLTGTTATEISVSDISGVTVLWEQGQYPGYAIHQTAGNYDISYAAGYVTFTASSDVKSTACVAVFKDGAGGTAGKYDKESDEILWSWLIWATPEPDTKIHNGKTFMDRNLGASTKLGGNYTRGFLFQWGRKDAFSAASGSNTDVYWFSPTAINVFTDYPTEVQYMAYTVAHPTARIVSWTDATHSWMPEAEYSKSPWREEVKTIYDPCPPGWKVPSKADMDGITGLPDTGLYGSTDKGATNANLRNFGNWETGYYWTSTISDDTTLPANAYAFCNDGRNIQNWSQAEGYAIRPVRE